MRQNPTNATVYAHPNREGKWNTVVLECCLVKVISPHILFGLLLVALPSTASLKVQQESHYFCPSAWKGAFERSPTRHGLGRLSESVSSSVCLWLR
jgi:hypothetical protein